MCRIRYFVLGFLLTGSFATNSRAEVTEKEGSWKYCVERTTTVRDNVANKKEVHIDRAFVYYGAGAKQAGGQIKSVPQVVYVDEDGDRLAKAIYYESAIVPHDSKKLGLFSMLPGDPGSEPNLPGPADILPKSFSILPLSPEAGLRKGLSWSSTLYVFYGETADFPFPATIKHELRRYEQKKGRRCAVINYTIAGRLKMADHPEWFTQEELHTNRGELSLQGGGTAYFDLAEGIIVEKEQTISWTNRGEKLARLEDGSIGWTPTADKGRTVAISVSLIPERGPKSRLVVYLLIIGGAGIVIAVLVLLRKKKASTRGA